MRGKKYANIFFLHFSFLKILQNDCLVPKYYQRVSANQQVLEQHNIK